MKLLYLALRNIGIHWKPAIEWRVAYAQFNHLILRTLADYNPLMLNRHGSVTHN